jgi:hypothetical protein
MGWGKGKKLGKRKRAHDTGLWASHLAETRRIDSRFDATFTTACHWHFCLRRHQSRVRLIVVCSIKEFGVTRFLVLASHQNYA